MITLIEQRLDCLFLIVWSRFYCSFKSWNCGKKIYENYMINWLATIKKKSLNSESNPFRDEEKFYRCQTGRTVRDTGISRHNGGKWRAPLKSLNTVVLWWYEVFQVLHDAERRQSLGKLYVWSLLFFQSVIDA